MPFKDFTVGQVLTSAEVDNFLMKQSVMVFDDEADRTSQLGTFVGEGMLTYLKNTDSLEYYSGAAFEPVSDPVLSQGEPGQYLESLGTAGANWENFINPLLLLGV